MSGNPSVKNTPAVSHDRVIDWLRDELRSAILIRRTYTIEQVAAKSGIKTRTLRSYMVTDPEEEREPCLSYALSIAWALGSSAVNSMLALIHMGGAEPLDALPEEQPTQIVAKSMAGLAVIAEAAADGRFDHTEKPRVTAAADDLIQILTPLSSAGKAA